ncbi:class I SAM-dependent methyltransferase [Paenibacillus arenilitoris]|uniref:Methyltransferase domain-containing protein n=1 Tax=Paenibacillus arenilitoris TaxID=2772299 RepID=A0A927H7C2_9BACL|nr:class I SAM-dependent methyltransferase [Paenibacillus arenilitoris]MBD2870498.1 methyltransferase domain-containing protein [Paenibacillus arenilitoris]
MKPWYEQSFGNDYTLVYKHRNWEQAGKEARKMADWLKLPPGARVLDIGCGLGRHALALARCGLSVTGVDLSPILLKQARRHDARREVKWVEGDMRELPFDAGRFDATVNLFTSFGYFSLEDDNAKVLRNIRRVLREEGAFLIDFLNPDYVERHLVPRSVRVDAETGQRIEEVRTIQGGWVQKEITITVPGKREAARQYLERVKLYRLDWFAHRLAECGLRLDRLYGDYDGSDYDTLHSPRMIMAGKAGAW